MSAPRTKPWEVSSGTSAAAAGGNNSNMASMSSEHSGVAGSTASSGATAIPERPTSLTSDFAGMSSSTPYGASSGYGSGYGARGYGTTGGYGSSMYGGGLGSSMYGSGFGGGGYGSSMYGGGYGSSMYGMGGGYGNSMYGMGGMGGMGAYGQPGMMGPGGLGEGTQATFQLIESIIGAVGGFAQMLEATYMATHSSFFTMVSLAEQFGNLKNALGSLLGIFALIKFAKKIFYKITGQTYNHGLNLKEFSKFEKNQKKLEDNIKRQASGTTRPQISFKPLLLFLAASIGFPYLLSKAIQRLNQQQQQRRQQELGGQPGPMGQNQPIDATNLQFAKALYEFNPENPNMEIELKVGELIAILSKLDPLGNESKWWKVRSRSGKVGYVPSNYLQIIERKTQQAPPIESAPPQSPQQPIHISQDKKLTPGDFQKFESNQ